MQTAICECICLQILIRRPTFIRHKDRQYKIETGTDRIKTRLKKRITPHKIFFLNTKTSHTTMGRLS